MYNFTLRHNHFRMTEHLKLYKIFAEHIRKIKQYLYHFILFYNI